MRDDRPREVAQVSGGSGLRVLVYADFRTSHAIAWTKGLELSGITVCRVSSELLEQDSRGRRMGDPVGLIRRHLVRSGVNRKVRSLMQRGQPRGQLGATNATFDLVQILETAATPVRYPAQSTALRRSEELFKPHIVHAMRIPYEGLTALSALKQSPVVISSWGQDFTRQAAGDPLLRSWMRRSLPHAAGLHVDSPADIEAAFELGLPRNTPVLHAAGNFGVDTTLFYPKQPDSRILVVYPRGQRSYVNTKPFLAMAQALTAIEDVNFIGVGLQGDSEAECLAKRLGPNGLRLTGELPRLEFAALMRTASIVVSPATTDGTPNSLIEALACGAYVMAGDIPSVAHLLEAPVSASRLDPDDHETWVRELRKLLDNREILQGARLNNPKAIREPYSLERNRTRVPDFYRRILTHC